MTLFIVLLVLIAVFIAFVLYHKKDDKIMNKKLKILREEIDRHNEELRDEELKYLNDRVMELERKVKIILLKPVKGISGNIDV